MTILENVLFYITLLCISIWNADKCLLPYYGGCPYSRQCITSKFTVYCDDCLFGFAEDPTNIGACLSKTLVE